MVDDAPVVVDDGGLADFAELEQLAAARHVAASSTTSGLNNPTPPASDVGERNGRSCWSAAASPDPVRFEACPFVGEVFSPDEWSASGWGEPEDWNARATIRVVLS
ncbi:MAG: hypothetical protein ACLPVY_07415 [Acidimicrobiia bacterium]